DVDLALRGRTETEVDVLDEVAHRVDASVRRRVELDEVVELARRDGEAVLALQTGLAVGAEVEAVERLGEQARGGGLASAAWPGKEVAVPDATFRDRVAKRRRDVILADELGESDGPVAPVERLVPRVTGGGFGHGPRLRGRCAATGRIVP